MAELRNTGTTDVSETTGKKSVRRRRRPAASTDATGKTVARGGRRPEVGTSFGFVSSDTTVKKSVTLRRSVAEEIEARAGVRGFSSFLDAAAERHLALLKAQEIVEDFEQRNGAIPAEVTADAERAWRGE